jgi:hypothetical protein
MAHHLEGDRLPAFDWELMLVLCVESWLVVASAVAQHL